jgi:hypothetical protein
MLAISFHDTQHGLVTWPLIDGIVVVTNPDECCKFGDALDKVDC